MLQALLAFHVLGGSIGLVVGPVPMLARKGSPLHRKVGLVFCVAMGCGCISAFALALTFHSKLLLTIAVLTGFLIFSGLRAAQFRRGMRTGRIDQVSCIVLACFSLWLLWNSAFRFDVTGIFFGLSGLILAARQWRTLRASRPDWLLAHIAGMGGAYVATVTAFVVVNLKFLPQSVAFITPAIIGTTLITWASARYAARSGFER